MLVTNQWLDKLAAIHVSFQALGMLSSSISDHPDQPDPQPSLATKSPDNANNEDNDGGAVDGTVLG